MPKTGFGKLKPERKSKTSAKPKQPKQTAKKARKSPRIKSYTFSFYSRDGVQNLIQIQAISQEQATEQFNCFVEILETYLATEDAGLERFLKRYLVGEGVQHG